MEIVLGGSADYTIEYEHIHIGPHVAILSGSADTEYSPSFEYTSSGVATSSGTADTEYSPIYEYVGSGTITIGGSVEELHHEYLFANGTITTSGSAITEYTQNYEYVASSGAILYGQADTFGYRGFEFIAGGMITTRGSSSSLFRQIPKPINDEDPRGYPSELNKLIEGDSFTGLTDENGEPSGEPGTFEFEATEGPSYPGEPRKITTHEFESRV